MPQDNYTPKSNTKKVLYNIEAEEALVGSALIGAYDVFEKVSVSVADFHVQKLAWIWHAIGQLVQDGAAVDPVTVTAFLEKNGKLAEIGGPAYLAKLLTVPESFYNAPEYAEIVQDFARRRKLVETAETLAKKAFSPNGASLDLQEVMASLEELQTGKNLPHELAEPSTWDDLSGVLSDVDWAWRPWLPKGMVTILAGESGSGKSNLALRIAACFLRGDPWPDKTAFAGETGLVLWCEAEAAQAIHITRSKKWGLPLDRIINLLDGELQDFDINNPAHRNALTIRANHPDVRLIVVDSLSGATGGRGEQEASMLEPVKFLAGLARDTGKPILITHHLRKRGIFDLDGVNLERLRGSSAIVQAARVVWALDKPDPQAGDWLRLSVIKSNLEKFPEPVGLLIEDSGLRFGLAPEPPKVETIADKAADLLMALLDSGPVLVNDIEKEVGGAGMSMVSVRRAKNKLGIVSVRKPNDANWYWSLPAKEYDN